MPPKKRGPKAHVKCAVVQAGFTFIDGTKSELVVGKEIGQGGFGRIYEGTLKSSRKSVAIKMEPMGNGPLFTEMHVYQKLLKKEHLDQWCSANGLKFIGLPSLISSGKFTYSGEEMRYIVIPKYGDSVERALERNDGSLPLNDVLTIAKGVLNALAYLHSQNYVHADVKASNLLMEKVADFKKVVLIDFGLAKIFSDSLVEKENKKQAHNGTAIFTSCDAHRGCSPSFRGDLEILTHNMLLWLTGSLPWKEYEDKLEKVYEMKKELIKMAEKEVPKLLKNKKEASIIVRFYATVREMEFTESIDVPKLLGNL
ncbi:protein kinase domain-containing protein [Ditylenchus destructor]|uniref:non-specific serine/threonine protein kinase n=1 Tax=Ditylenchus destructor TaxID=166010 RepID=A0AAD4N0E8_9BILA|nr:protein kinase domain-containing protein [Ditylenchus destructor]